MLSYLILIGGMIFSCKTEEAPLELTIQPPMQRWIITLYQNVGVDSLNRVTYDSEYLSLLAIRFTQKYTKDDTLFYEGISTHVTLSNSMLKTKFSDQPILISMANGWIQQQQSVYEGSIMKLSTDTTSWPTVSRSQWPIIPVKLVDQTTTKMVKREGPNWLEVERTYFVGGKEGMEINQSFYEGLRVNIHQKILDFSLEYDSHVLFDRSGKIAETFDGGIWVEMDRGGAELWRERRFHLTNRIQITSEQDTNPDFEQILLSHKDIKLKALAGRLVY